MAIQISIKPSPLTRPRTKLFIRNSRSFRCPSSSEFSVHMRVQGSTVNMMPTSRQNSTKTMSHNRRTQRLGRFAFCGGGITRIGPSFSARSSTRGSSAKELMRHSLSGARRRNQSGHAPFPAYRISTPPTPPSPQLSRKPYAGFYQRRFELVDFHRLPTPDSERFVSGHDFSRALVPSLFCHSEEAFRPTRNLRGDGQPATRRTADPPPTKVGSG